MASTPPITSSAPPATSLDVLKYARRRAVVAWVGAILSVGLLLAEQHMRVLHPLVLTFVFLLLVTSIAALGGMARALWWIRRGPRRFAALGWAALSLLPGLLWPSLIWYGIYARRGLSTDLPSTLIKMAATTLLEGEAYYFYPHRLETDRLGMFYRDGLTDPKGDAEAMDRHVARMEEMTGLVHREKIWWVRGSCLGQSGLALYGVALGSSESPAAALDRHELAHSVCWQHAYPDSDPPTLLMEGWAESQSVDSNELAQRALAERKFIRDLAPWVTGMSATERAEFLRTLVDPDGRWRLFQLSAAGGQTSYLRELTGPYWYHHGNGPVYSIGGAFVDFLLRHYGTRRFIELSFACRPDSFEASCQSIYGVGLDALEQQFWGDLQKRTASAAP